MGSMRLGGASATSVLKTQRSDIPDGRWWVTPAFIQTTGDAAVQLNSANDGIAVRITPQTDILFDSVSRFVTALATQGNGTLSICADSSDEPGSELQALGSFDSGDTADVWTRLAIETANQYQAQRGMPVWLKMMGADGADWSESIRRPNTAIGSAMPDEMDLCLVTTDGGSTWTQATQDGLPAMWNVVVNSVADKHVPHLCYGRYVGKYCFLPDTDMAEIPEEGVLFDCSGLTDATEYYGYIYNNSGVLALDLSTTVPITDVGIKVKTGATTRRYVGGIVARALISTYHGPIDVEDSREVWNAHNRRFKTIGKNDPYAGTTSEALSADAVWYSWSANGDHFTSRLLVQETTSFDFCCFIGSITNHAAWLSVGIDSKAPFRSMEGRSIANAFGSCELSITVQPGSHTIYALIKEYTTGAGTAYYHYTPANGGNYLSRALGTVRM
jgi:hypothetical protein